MIDISLDVDGVVAGVKRVSAALPGNVTTALELGAELVANQAKAVHTYEDQTGALTNSIGSDGVHGTWGADLHAIVAAGAAHGIYVEKGTKAHKIKPKHRKKLRWSGPNGFMFAGEVDHPGTAPTNFLANALAAKLPEVSEVLSDAVGATFAEAGFEAE